MNQAQKKHLIERLAGAVREQKYGDSMAAERDTKEVAAARALVARWDKAQSRGIDARRKRIDDAARKVREAIHFADADKALAAVNKFEARSAG